MVLNDNAVVVTGFYDFSRLKDREAQSSRSRFTMLPVKLAPFGSGEHVEQLLLLDCPPWPRPHLCRCEASILLGVPEN